MSALGAGDSPVLLFRCVDQLDEHAIDAGAHVATGVRSRATVPLLRGDDETAPVIVERFETREKCRRSLSAAMPVAEDRGLDRLTSAEKRVWIQHVESRKDEAASTAAHVHPVSDLAHGPDRYGHAHAPI